MRLELKDIIHTPDAVKPFRFQMDLSDEEFHGQTPITQPVSAAGTVTNHAGALTLEGTASSQLSLICDRCGKPFERVKSVTLDCLLAQELANADEHDEIILLQGSEVDLDDLVSTAFILAMDTKNLCSDDCKGLCTGCGADLNAGPCGCKPEVDPRLAALAQLLGDVTE